MFFGRRKAAAGAGTELYAAPHVRATEASAEWWRQFDTTLTLKNVALGSLHADDFRFGAA